MKRNYKKAFSLIELSIVILIIGILIAGVISSSSLVSKIRLASARSLTNSSPVSSIKDIVLWLDSTSENSFLSSEASDESNISHWYDLNPQTTLKNNFSNNSENSSDHPSYLESCINSLPCVKFNGTSSYLTSDIEPNYSYEKITSFIVFKTNSFLENQIIYNSASPLEEYWKLGESAFRIGLSYSSIFYQLPMDYGIGYWYSNYFLNNDVTYIYELVDNHSEPIFNYINGTVINYNGNGQTLKTFRSQNIGAKNERYSSEDGDNIVDFFDGYIGEIIIFGKSLTSSERDEVRNYLFKKWNVSRESIQEVY